MAVGGSRTGRCCSSRTVTFRASQIPLPLLCPARQRDGRNQHRMQRGHGGRGRVVSTSKRIRRAAAVARGPIGWISQSCSPTGTAPPFELIYPAQRSWCCVMKQGMTMSSCNITIWHDEQPTYTNFGRASATKQDRGRDKWSFLTPSPNSTRALCCKQRHEAHRGKVCANAPLLIGLITEEVVSELPVLPLQCIAWPALVQ